MLTAYLRCPSGKLQLKAEERDAPWEVTGLSKWMERQPVRIGGRRIPVARRPFPNVLVRGAATHQSADVMCFDATQRNPSLNLTTNECMRIAYQNFSLHGYR